MTETPGFPGGLPEMPKTDLPDKSQVQYRGPIRITSSDPKVVVTKIDETTKKD